MTYKKTLGVHEMLLCMLNTNKTMGKRNPLRDCLRSFWAKEFKMDLIVL